MDTQSQSGSEGHTGANARIRIPKQILPENSPGCHAYRNANAKFQDQIGSPNVGESRLD